MLIFQNALDTKLLYGSNSFGGNPLTPSQGGRVAWWLATCAWKPKVPGSSPAASYAQR